MVLSMAASASALANRQEDARALLEEAAKYEGKISNRQNQEVTAQAMNALVIYYLARFRYERCGRDEDGQQLAEYALDRASEHFLNSDNDLQVVSSGENRSFVLKYLSAWHRIVDLLYRTWCNAARTSPCPEGRERRNVEKGRRSGRQIPPRKYYNPGSVGQQIEVARSVTS
ncbi:hypothetical protein FA10DRAFT_86326 [Acaromyces ingoldii]|uniref:Uncharacterized protein n=1 Tax=Acaromyces ingoldii TaxID=215250 RepID=A0A316YVV5_9BASI|nr:hypothetical protein FA10DRAFT_86326 [Acaromyces ingoldii]PWN92183.1 hypothetical protein FA10DRAFT_86326 [Acaromyces ingoldii]